MQAIRFSWFYHIESWVNFLNHLQIRQCFPNTHVACEHVCMYLCMYVYTEHTPMYIDPPKRCSKDYKHVFYPFFDCLHIFTQIHTCMHCKKIIVRIKKVLELCIVWRTRGKTYSCIKLWSRRTEVGIHKRKHESKKTRKQEKMKENRNSTKKRLRKKESFFFIS